MAEENEAVSVCPRCGEPTDELHEGYCRLCCEEGQRALDLHNAEVDFWSGLTDDERERRIRWAMR